MIQNFMEEALHEGVLALSLGEVPIGCVFVIDNEIIVRAGNAVNATKNATRHAEMICIDKLFKHIKDNNIDDYKGYFKKVSVYVTVEPCIMCAAALYELNVRQIIFGCANDRFGGMSVLSVEKVLDKVIPYQGGVYSEEAMAMLKEFYKGTNPSAPPAIRR